MSELGIRPVESKSGKPAEFPSKESSGYLFFMNIADMVAQKIKSLDVGVVPILNRGKADGIVTDRDIVIRAVAESRDPRQIKVQEIMTQNVAYINADARLEEAAKLMEDKKVRRLLVVNGEEKVIGIVSFGDIANHARPRLAPEVLKGVSEPRATPHPPQFLP